MIYRNFLVIVDRYDGDMRDYLRSQLAFLKSKNCRCLLVTGCDGRQARADGFDGILSSFHCMGEKRQKTIRKVLRRFETFARIQAVDIIHCHACRGSSYAALAAARLDVPFVCTLQSRRYLCAFVDGRRSMLTNRLRAEASITFALSDQILADYQRVTQGRRGVVLPSPVAQRVSSSTIPHPGCLSRWFWAGRLDADKLPGLWSLIDFAAEVDLGTLDIFGEGNAKSLLEARIRNQESRTTIALRGWRLDVGRRRFEYGVGCGMGQVARDSLSAGLPTLFVGQDRLHGFIDRTNIVDFLASKFDGRAGRGISPDRFAAQLLDLRFNPQRFDLSNWLQQRSRDDRIWQTFEGLVDARAAPPKLNADRYIELLAPNPKQSLEQKFQSWARLFRSLSGRVTPTMPVRRRPGHLPIHQRMPAGGD